MINQMKLQAVIDLHEEVKKRHWDCGMKDFEYRRIYEDEHSMNTELKHNNKNYLIEQETRITGKYTYYDLKIYEDGQKLDKDIRFIKKLLKEEKEVE